MSFRSLAHLIDEAALRRAYERLRKDAAVGVDGVTKEAYGHDLDERLGDLRQRLRTKRYRHQPIRRVHIPKAPGTTRPIGVSTIEDKIVQGAIREVLEAAYEQDFLDCSYGFRPGRSAHDALRTLNRILWNGEANWILEADIESFFDSIDRSKLQEILRLRVADGSLLRLVGRCLHVGVLDGSVARDRRPLTFWASRCTGGGRAGEAGRWASRRAGRASRGRSPLSTSGVAVTDTYRSKCNTRRCAGA